uniref:Odorant binding protein 6 n=1 Tax=Agrilus mali TaxID=1917227 RepID=A0A2R4H1G3_9COLE|nr:odorant binding protein 6 [Agrilus mali]
MSVSFLLPLLVVGVAVANPPPEMGHHGHIFDVCCDVRPFMANPDDNNMKECVKEILGEPTAVKHGPPSEKEMEEMAEKITCVEECTAKKYGVVDDDGNIVIPKITEFSKEKMKGTYMESIMEDTLQKCIEETGKEVQQTKCNPKPLLLVNCLFFKTLENCPADKVKDKAKCDSLIEDMRTGKPPHLLAPPLPPSEN